jgi:YceI-like domain
MRLGRPRVPRTRRGRLLSGLGVGVVAAGLAYGGFAVLAGGSSPAPLALKASGGTPQPPTGHIAGTWTVGTGSVAGYRVRERLAILPAVATTGQVVKVTATGPLTLHGVTRTESIPLSLQLSGSTFEVVGSISFPWSDFGMSAPDFGDFVTVEGTATMELDLKLVKS